MSFNVEVPSGKDFPKPSGGVHVARLVRIVDIGTHKSTFQGEDTGLKHYVYVFWELPNDTYVIEGGEEKGKEVCHTAMKRYNLSIHGRSALRKDMKSWKGKDVIGDKTSFDISSIIGDTCQLSLVENGDYMNIDTFMPLPKGMDVPQGNTDSYYFNIKEFDDSVFQRLGKKTQEKIMQSVELRDNTPVLNETVAALSEAEGDNIPF